MNRDTYHTFSYKGSYITTCYDRDLKKEIVQVGGQEFESVHAAKCFITRHLN